MKKLITEIRGWITIKDSEALILSKEFSIAKQDGSGGIVVQQIYDAYVNVTEQRTKLSKALAILL